jgi:RNA polymerase sigma factor (TIGR02999 family)
MPDFTVTQQLNGYPRLGHQQRDELFRTLYPELHRIARALTRAESIAHTVNATALLHEAFLALFDGLPLAYENRRHFFATAARKMRHLLIDLARRRRSRNQHTTAWQALEARHRARMEANLDLVLHLEAAFEHLRAANARLCAVADLHFVLGLNFREIACVLEYSETSARRDWQVARDILEEYLLGHV